MIIEPLQNYVLIEEIKKSESDFGIILPEAESNQLTERGRIISKGDGVQLKIQEGDVVLFKPYGFEEFEVDKKVYKIGREEHIFAIIKQ